MPDRIFFHVKPLDVQGSKYTLGIDESNHLTRVLRKTKGAGIWLLDGIGTVYSARVDSIQNGQARGIILKSFPHFGENQFEVHLALAVLKRNRMELALEKATEMGVNSITPLILDRSIKRTVNLVRLSKIVTSAAKQSGRSVIPQVNEPVSLLTWMKTTREKKPDRVVCHSGSTTSISEWFGRRANPTNPVQVLIGPEGDFSPGELKLLTQEDIPFITLGPRRLRSETAVITVLAVLNEIINTQKEAGL